MVSLETGIALIIIGIILLVLNRFVPSLPARLLYVIGSIVTSHWNNYGYIIFCIWNHIMNFKL